MITSETPLRPLVAGNWKMNGLRSAIGEAIAVRDALTSLAATRAAATGPAATGPEVMICPPATLLHPLAEATQGSRLQVGGQDCHWEKSGANTGDVSAEMLADAGASAVIVGHSERRADHGELDQTVRKKATAAHDAGLVAIICVGETAGQRGADLTLEVVKRQLQGSLPDTATAANTVIAYEPVWAIGTGLTPTAADVAETHAAIRTALIARFQDGGTGMRILYGGSVKPANARELLAIANVNGALVGGASLRAVDFLKIIEAYA